jgi:hypothetical protein
MKEKKSQYKIIVKKLHWKIQLGNPGIVMKIVLELISIKCVVMVCTGFRWLKTTFSTLLSV